MDPWQRKHCHCTVDIVSLLHCGDKELLEHCLIESLRCSLNNVMGDLVTLFPRLGRVTGQQRVSDGGEGEEEGSSWNFRPRLTCYVTL
jgi:hypothetical protein